ncbi:hypothetical protein EDD17DRAFT_1509224 [Pisolithus thermaeus]|nr:hypothetical protein EDD17DRAFT_1509224 [Pisolithus thermaeus]
MTKLIVAVPLVSTSKSPYSNGNFKAEHMHEWQPDDQEYIEATLHITEKSACNNHKAISQASASCRKLNSTGVGATACVGMVAFTYILLWTFKKEKESMEVGGQHQVSGDCTLIEDCGGNQDVACSQTQKGMLCKIFSLVYQSVCVNLWDDITTLLGTIELPNEQLKLHENDLDEYIQNVSSLLQKLKVAQVAVLLAQEAFESLNDAVPFSKQENWQREEGATLKDCIHDPSVMDIFEIQLMKVPDHGSAPTVHGVELCFLQTSTSNGMHHGAASWLTCGLVIEEAEITLAISQKAIGPHPSDLK